MASGIRPLLIAILASLWAVPLAAQSIESARFGIAYYGAFCLMNATSVEMHPSTQPVTLNIIAAQSGVHVDQIQSWASARAQEQAIAVAVLNALRDEDGYNDPPEPFLMMLRQTQIDCQEVWRNRNVLAAAKDRVVADGGTVLPFGPFVMTEQFADKILNERVERLAWVIYRAPYAIEAGFSDKVHQLATILAGMPLSLEPRSDGIVLGLDDERAYARRLLATP